ncbi:MAG: DUF3300 domain-containing protein [Thalassotalea sp.]
MKVLILSSASANIRISRRAIKSPHGNVLMKTIGLSSKATLLTVIMLLAMFVSVQSLAYEADISRTQGENTQYSQAELAQLLAPIALYPDTLLSHILIAATYPLEVIEAQRFLVKYENLSTEKLEQKAEYQDWDASVKALLSFPKIINKLSDDLSWMQNIAGAFLADEEAVLASIQQLRQQADDAGNLAQLSRLKVERDNNIIVISSPSPEVVYVPYYDSRVVYGHWRWHHFPPVYWHAPVHVNFHHGPYAWHRAALHITGNFFFSAFHWHNKHVVIHHERHNFYKKKHYLKRTTSYQGKHWRKSSPHHKSYPVYRQSDNRKQSHKYFNRHAVSVYGKNKHTIGKSAQARTVYKSAEKQHLSHSQRFQNKLKQQKHLRVKGNQPFKSVYKHSDSKLVQQKTKPAQRHNQKPSVNKVNDHKLYKSEASQTYRKNQTQQHAVNVQKKNKTKVRKSAERTNSSDRSKRKSSDKKYAAASRSKSSSSKEHRSHR